VAVNCGAIPEALVESILFGHEKGSFTGAIAQHRGVFEQADGGTIFLDEIGELDLNLQPKLLRVLESRELKRVGSDRTIGVDVRVLAATNRDLRTMVTDGGFREDLYFRLSVVQLQLPPLRRRPDDVPVLVQAFLDRVNEQRERTGQAPLRVSDDALAARRERPWPGNIRELKNVVERASSLGEGPLLSRADFLLGSGILGAGTGTQSPPPAPAAAAQPSPAAPGDPGADLQAPVDIDLAYKDAKQALLDQFEAIYLKKLMDRHEGNISQGARAAGLTRYHLRELLKKHDIHKG